MRRIFVLICAALAAILVVFIIPAFAAGEPFTISGQVIDAVGYPVAGANVSLIDNNYKVIGVRTTNDEGNYDFVNVISDTDTVTVRVSLGKNGKTYKVPSYYTRWYPSRGILYINKGETQFADYPEPTEGYVYGAIKSNMSPNALFLTGEVYLTSVSAGTEYHEFANSTDGKGSFYFHVPPGDYDIYAIHDENGKKSMTDTQRITVMPSWNVNEHLPVVLAIAPGLIHLPLHLMPQIGSPPPTGLSPQTAMPSGIAAISLLLAALVCLLLLAGLHMIFKKTYTLFIKIYQDTAPILYQKIYPLNKHL